MLKFFLKLKLEKRCLYTVVNGNCDIKSAEFMMNLEKFDKLNHEKIEFEKQIKDGGGERSKINHQRKNKKLVEDRLHLLFDEGKYLELGFFTGYGQVYGNIARAGCICAIGRVNKRYVAAIASDATVKAGTTYPIQLRKQLRLFDIAENLRLPIVYIIDSGGAFLPLQSEIFPDKHHGGRVFYNIAHLQSLGIPALTLVCGSCTAGAAYIPTMSSENGMVKGTSHIFLGGPPLVKAAIGEVIDAEDLGGSKLHSSISGCTDYNFSDETEGISTLRDNISSFPRHSHIDIHYNSPSDPLYHSEHLNGLLINSCDDFTSRKLMAYQILSRILDHSSLNEFKQEYGRGIITGFGQLNGYTVGILLNYDELSEAGCTKASHFIQLCSQRIIPVISFIHTIEPTQLSSNDYAEIIQSQDLLIKSNASLMRSLATRSFRLISVVIGDYIASQAYSLGGEYMNSDFTLAWTNSRFGYNKMGEFTDSFSAAGYMVVDNLITPSQTRQKLSELLEIINTNTNLPSESSNSPVYRF